jgi:hypothetical protein
LAGGFL